MTKGWAGVENASYSKKLVKCKSDVGQQTIDHGPIGPWIDGLVHQNMCFTMNPFQITSLMPIKIKITSYNFYFFFILELKVVW